LQIADFFLSTGRDEASQYAGPPHVTASKSTDATSKFWKERDEFSRDEEARAPQRNLIPVLG
jgi:hypothetical protein